MTGHNHSLYPFKNWTRKSPVFRLILLTLNLLWIVLPERHPPNPITSHKSSLFHQGPKSEMKLLFFIMRIWNVDKYVFPIVNLGWVVQSLIFKSCSENRKENWISDDICHFEFFNWVNFAFQKLRINWRIFSESANIEILWILRLFQTKLRENTQHANIAKLKILWILKYIFEIFG